jgi:catechol 2,3-dioxygenase
MSVMDRASLVKSTLIDHIQRVDLRVRDIDAALSFYRDVVGLDVVDQDGSTARLASGNGPTFITLNSQGVTAPADPGATGLFHTAIRFPTRRSLGDALARLVQAGLSIGASDHLVSEALYIDDPDGNGVELYWDRPEEEWPPPTPDMLVPMASLHLDLQNLMDEGTGYDALHQPAPAGTDVGHVHLQVSDVDATATFYSEALGLDMTAKLGDQAGFFSSNGYHHNLGANSWRSRGGRPARPDSAGLERVVFAVSEPGKLDAVRSRLLERGVEVSGDSATRLEVRDPDGIELHFVTE